MDVTCQLAKEMYMSLCSSTSPFYYQYQDGTTFLIKSYSCSHYNYIIFVLNEEVDIWGAYFDQTNKLNLLEKITSNFSISSTICSNGFVFSGVPGNFKQLIFNTSSLEHDYQTLKQIILGLLNNEKKVLALNDDLFVFNKINGIYSLTFAFTLKENKYFSKFIFEMTTNKNLAVSYHSSVFYIYVDKIIQLNNYKALSVNGDGYQIDIDNRSFVGVFEPGNPIGRLTETSIISPKLKRLIGEPIRYFEVNENFNPSPLTSLIGLGFKDSVPQYALVRFLENDNPFTTFTTRNVKVKLVKDNNIAFDKSLNLTINGDFANKIKISNLPLSDITP